MTTITTDFVGSETAAVTRSRLTEILEWWGNAPDDYTTWGNARTDLNALLSGTATGTIGANELAGSFLSKINLVNDPDALIAEAFPTAQLITTDPDRVFSDTSGTTPAVLGGPVAALRDGGGAIIATQTTSAARPTYGRHPASGLRNRLPNNRMDGAVVGVLGAGGSLPTGWGLGSSISQSGAEVLSIAPKNGRPNIRLRLTGTPTGNVQISAPVTNDVKAQNGQTWTNSVWLQQVAGTQTNVDALAILQINLNSSGGFVSSTGFSSFGSTATEDLRRVSTTTLATPNIAFTRNAVQLSWSSGAIDITLDISAPQLEQASAASDVQITGANGFDVTEAGQRSVYYLKPDGLDDSLQFSSAFAGQTSYTLAAAHDIKFLPAAPNEGVIFGGTSRFTKTLDNGLRWRNQGTENQIDYNTQAVSGRQVDLLRVAGAGVPEAWRNGQAATVSGSAGSFSPLVGLSHLFMAGSTYSGGRFYGGALIPAAISEPERLMLQRYLAQKGGITL